MNWIKEGTKLLGRSATRLGPFDLLGATLDYAGGKQEGEDDVRAVAGAAGSTAGGLGGALAGAAAGSVLGPVGTAVGAIAGATGGGFLGGWGADRVDEGVRGNRNKGQKKMANFYDRYYNEENDSFDFGDGAMLIPSAYGGYELIRGLKNAGMPKITNPLAEAAVVRGAGGNMGQIAQAAGRGVTQAGGEVLSHTGRVLKNVPVLGKLALGAAAAKVADDTFNEGRAGRALAQFPARVIDTATEQTTNLDNDPVNQQRKILEKQRPLNQLQADYSLERLRNDPNNRYMREIELDNQRRLNERADYVWNRDKNEAWRASVASFQAKQAQDLLNAYSRDIPLGVAQSIQAIFSARL